MCCTMYRYFILSFVPRTVQPKIYVPLGVLVMAIIGIAIFSFFPILQNILFLSTRIGFTEAFQSVLFTFETGKAWMLTLIVSTVIFLFILMFDEQRNKLYGFVGLALSIVLILTLGWSSHASSIDRVWGFIGDSLHLLAVSVWVGILFVVSWFSKNYCPLVKILKVVYACCDYLLVSNDFYRDTPHEFHGGLGRIHKIMVDSLWTSVIVEAFAHYSVTCLRVD